MEKDYKYYVSLDDKIISEKPIEGEATLEIIATPENVEEIKKYMHKDEAKDEHVGERYEEDLKKLFQLIYDLGTKETKNSLDKMIK